jgi:hypothetical protein
VVVVGWLRSIVVRRWRQGSSRSLVLMLLRPLMLMLAIVFNVMLSRWRPWGRIAPLEGGHRRWSPSIRRQFVVTILAEIRDRRAIPVLDGFVPRRRRRNL